MEHGFVLSWWPFFSCCLCLELCCPVRIIRNLVTCQLSLRSLVPCACGCMLCVCVCWEWWACVYALNLVHLSIHVRVCVNEFPVCVCPSAKHAHETIWAHETVIMVLVNSEVRTVIQIGFSHSLQSCSHSRTCQYSSVNFTTIYNFILYKRWCLHYCTVWMSNNLLLILSVLQHTEQTVWHESQARDDNTVMYIVC